MKKIIIFLSVVCLITTCFTIVTFAEETTSTVIQAGEWIGNESFDQSIRSNIFDFAFTVSGETSEITFTGMKWNVSSDVSKTYMTYITESGTYVKAYSYGDGWVELYRSITVLEDTKVSSSQYEWFVSNFTFVPEITECDGSACSVTDTDKDNICDNCGLVLSYNLRSTLLDFAHSEITTAQSQWATGHDYWLIAENGNGSYNIYLSADIFTYDSETGKLYADGAIQGQTVVTMDDGSFGSQGWSTQVVGSISFARSAVVESSHEGFFPRPPLWEEILGVAEGEIQNQTLPNLGGTMMILVVCGISLVALLVLLVLLAKKLRIFLH